MFLQGLLAVSDKFDRIRLLIDSEEATIFISNYDPFTKFQHLTDGIYGECVFTIPLKHRPFWLAKVKEIRGQRVKIDFKIRKWTLPGKKGISFDIVDIVKL